MRNKNLYLHYYLLSSFPYPLVQILSRLMEKQVLHLRIFLLPCIQTPLVQITHSILFPNNCIMHRSWP